MAGARFLPPHPAAVPKHRCRLCTANDVDGIIDQLAEDLWESRRYGTLDDVPFAECGPHWQRVFRELAETAFLALR